MDIEMELQPNWELRNSDPCAHDTPLRVWLERLQRFSFRQLLKNGNTTIGKLVSPSPVPISVDFDRCNVRLGDYVTPRTVIGSDCKNSALVQAGCYGTITAIRFSGSSPEMIVFIQPENRLIG
jgi:hypothetical protein